MIEREKHLERESDEIRGRNMRESEGEREGGWENKCLHSLYLSKRQNTVLRLTTKGQKN